MSAEEQLPEAEWSYFIEADNITDEKQKLQIRADDEQCKNLASRLGIPVIERASADFVLSRVQGNMVVHVEGELQADAVQECVVTADPVKTHIEESFEAWFVDPQAAISFTKARKEKEMKKGQGETLITEESDDPEPIIDGKIDLGDLAAQYLSLGLDPYPHAPGVENHHKVGDDDQRSEPIMENPFAGLKEWKAKLTKGDS